MDALALEEYMIPFDEGLTRLQEIKEEMGNLDLLEELCTSIALAAKGLEASIGFAYTPNTGLVVLGCGQGPFVI